MHWFRADNKDARNICDVRSQLLHWALTFSAGPKSARSHCHTKEDGYNACRCGSHGDGHAGALRSPAPPSARDPLDNQPRASVPSFN